MRGSIEEGNNSNTRNRFNESTLVSILECYVLLVLVIVWVSVVNHAWMALRVEFISGTSVLGCSS